MASQPTLRWVQTHGDASKQRDRRYLACTHRQRGVALLLLIFIVLVLGGTLGIRALNLAGAKGGGESAEATKTLALAKDALLAWSRSVDITSTQGYRAVRPGALPYPDVYGTATSSGPILYDGMQDLGCIIRTWTVAASQTLVTPYLAPTTIRCLGKLPWRMLGVNLRQDGTTDGAGVVPWYAVSANLVDHSYGAECPARLDASIATAGATGCGTVAGAATRPFPWLVVRDPFGAIISNRVAAVILLPGPPAARQTGTLTQASRGTVRVNPDQFLDTVRNTQCTGGFCDNARYRTAATSPMEFIQCVPAVTTTKDARFTQPYSCNDRLVYITIDELMQVASDRIAVEAISCINAFAKTNDRTPFADNTLDRRADTGATSGYLPSSYWDDTGSLADWLPYCPFFSNLYWDSWQRVVDYAVSPTHAVAGGWSGAGSLSIPGKSGAYKVTLRITINGLSTWYGIQ